MKWTTGLVIVFSSFLFASPSFAGDVTLNDWCVNVNGDYSTVCNGVGTTGDGVNMSSFDSAVGSGNTLGSFTVSLGAGLNQSLAFYADYDVDGLTLGSYLDSASTFGSLPSDWSYSINDPSTYDPSSNPSGFVLFDAFANFPNPVLDDSNSAGTPVNNPPNVCCDIAWALGITGLDVEAGGSATVTFTVADSAPTSGFYLQQTNIDTNNSIYLSADVTIVPPSTSGVPEPSTFVLGLGILGVAAAGMRFKRARV